MDKHYTIQQAAEAAGVKPYVLRYWEEELGLSIGRNEMGYRCYTGYDIQLFLNIKELKKRGLKLSAIRELLPRISQREPQWEENRILLLGTEEKENTKILEFQKIMERLICQEMQIKSGGEAQCRKLDAAIRRQQMVRREAAAAAENKEKRKWKIHK